MNYFYLHVNDETIYDINVLWWDKLILKYLNKNNNFEIRCWNKEQKEIKEALYFGKINKTNQIKKYETSIIGTTTNSFKEYILNHKKINKTNQLTQFFTINLGKNFSSEHYGNQINIRNLSELDIIEIKTIIEPIESYISDSFN